jgi:hypothetical protein
MGLWCLTPLSTIFQLYRGGQEETEVPGENHRSAVGHWQTWSYNNGISSTRCLSGVRTHSVSGDIYRHWLNIYIGSYKSKYHDDDAQETGASLLDVHTVKI